MFQTAKRPSAIVLKFLIRQKKKQFNKGIVPLKENMKNKAGGMTIESFKKETENDHCSLSYSNTSIGLSGIP